MLFFIKILVCARLCLESKRSSLYFIFNKWYILGGVVYLTSGSIYFMLYYSTTLCIFSVHANIYINLIFRVFQTVIRYLSYVKRRTEQLLLFPSSVDLSLLHSTVTSLSVLDASRP